MVVELTNGCSFVFPARSLQGLAGASDAELARIEILGIGYGLHWPALDADFTVPGLLMGVFGTRAWMASELARRASILLALIAADLQCLVLAGSAGAGVPRLHSRRGSASGARPRRG